MKTETIEKILNFLNTKEGKETPKKWFDSIEKLKLIEELENHPDGTQYKYDGDLDVMDSNIKKLPNDLYVDGSLFLNDCKQLTELPDKLYVSFILSLRYTNISELPNNLYVGDNLDLFNSNITELPKKLFVGGNLFIRNTPLAQKYSNKEIRKIVASTGGEIKKRIIIY